MITKNLPFALVMSAVFLTSCIKTRLVAYYDTDNIVHNKATRVSYFWGIVQPRDIPANCESNAICQVSTEMNAGYIILSFVTLGIVVPQRLVWDCCGTDIKEEVLD